MLLNYKILSNLTQTQGSWEIQLAYIEANIFGFCFIIQIQFTNEFKLTCICRELSSTVYDPFSQGTSSNTDPRSMGTNPSEGNFTSWSQAYNSTGHQHQQQHHHHSTALLSPTLFPHIQVFLLVHTILTWNNKNFTMIYESSSFCNIHMVAVRTLNGPHAICAQDWLDQFKFMAWGQPSQNEFFVLGF